MSEISKLHELLDRFPRVAVRTRKAVWSLAWLTKEYSKAFVLAWIVYRQPTRLNPCKYELKRETIADKDLLEIRYYASFN